MKLCSEKKLKKKFSVFFLPEIIIIIYHRVFFFLRI